jgi:hypothetical protein
MPTISAPLSKSQRIWKTIQRVIQENRKLLNEESTFYIYRTDTNAILARNIQGFENAKAAANEIRKKLKLKWDEIKFKAERKPKPSNNQYFTNARGETNKIEYAPRYNPSKGRHFRGFYDKFGNYHDLD